MSLYRRINGRLAVSPQIYVNDVAGIAAAGYKTIVCNRPDKEDTSQPSFSDIEREARKYNLRTHWQPVYANAISDVQGHDFGMLLKTLPVPILAYCRSGMRCIMLLALSEANERPIKDIVSDAARAGYDISGLIPRLKL
ncbi:MAG: Beta-lactamase hydrolase-like protein [Hyphomicrobiaceae bacterium hypho_1]